MSDLKGSMMISASGMRAQGLRMRVIAENMANSDSISTNAGEDPYRRKIVTFKSELDRATGVTTLAPDNVTYDQSDFGLKYDPGHPAANEEGYIRTPNVNGLLETMDMLQAQRTYEANLTAIDVAKRMMGKTLQILES